MSKLYKLIVLSILLLEVNFFSLIELPNVISSLNSYRDKSLMLIVVLFSLFFTFIIGIFSRTNIKRYYSSSVIMFLVIIVIISLLSLTIYNQSIFSVLRTSYYYFVIVIYFFLTYFCLRRRSNYLFLENSIIVIGIIYSALLVIQYLFLEMGLGQFLVFGEYYLQIIPTSSGPRIAQPVDFIAFSTIILLIKLYRLRNSMKLKYYLYGALILNLLYVGMVSKTRMYIISTIIVFIVSFFMGKRRNKTVKIIFYAFSLIIALFLLRGVFVDFFNTFTQGGRVSSTTIRLEEIGYYSSKIFENILFGLGFVDSTNIEYFNLVHGPYGVYFYSDVGILGFLAVFGVLGALFLISILFRLSKTLIILKRAKEYTKYNELRILILYVSMVSLTLFYMDIQRILYLPLILTIFEIYNQEASKIMNISENSDG